MTKYVTIDPVTYKLRNISSEVSVILRCIPRITYKSLIYVLQREEDASQLETNRQLTDEIMASRREKSNFVIF